MRKLFDGDAARGADLGANALVAPLQVARHCCGMGIWPYGAPLPLVIPIMLRQEWLGREERQNLKSGTGSWIKKLATPIAAHSVRIGVSLMLFVVSEPGDIASGGIVRAV